MSKDAYGKYRDMHPSPLSYTDWCEAKSMRITSELLDGICIDYLPASIETITIRKCHVGPRGIEIIGRLPNLRTIILEDGSTPLVNLNFDGYGVENIICRNNPVGNIKGKSTVRPNKVLLDCISIRSDLLSGLECSNIKHLAINGTRKAILPAGPFPKLEKLELITDDDILDFTIEASQLYDLALVGAKVTFDPKFEHEGILEIIAQHCKIESGHILNDLAAFKFTGDYLDIGISDKCEYLADLKIDTTNGMVNLVNASSLTYVDIKVEKGVVCLPKYSESLQLLTCEADTIVGYGTYPGLRELSITSHSGTDTIDISESVEMAYLSYKSPDECMLVMPKTVSDLMSFTLIDGGKKLSEVKLPESAPLLEEISIYASNAEHVYLPKDMSFVSKMRLICADNLAIHAPEIVDVPSEYESIVESY